MAQKLNQDSTRSLGRNMLNPGGGHPTLLTRPEFAAQLVYTLADDELVFDFGTIAADQFKAFHIFVTDVNLNQVGGTLNVATPANLTISTATLSKSGGFIVRAQAVPAAVGVQTVMPYFEIDPNANWTQDLVYVTNPDTVY